MCRKFIYNSSTKQVRAGLHPGYSSVLFTSLETWGENGLSELTGYSPSSEETKAGTQSRNLEAGTKARAMEKYFLAACSTWLTQPGFLHYRGPPAQVWHQLHWANSSHINYPSRNCPTGLPIHQYNGGILSVKTLPLRWPYCVSSVSTLASTPLYFCVWCHFSVHVIPLSWK